MIRPGKDQRQQPFTNRTAGTYRFYIYDFSDQSDEESKNMSDKSGAIVTVYRGSTLLNTFSVPTGQSGNCGMYAIMILLQQSNQC